MSKIAEETGDLLSRTVSLSFASSLLCFLASAGPWRANHLLIAIGTFNYFIINRYHTLFP